MTAHPSRVRTIGLVLGPVLALVVSGLMPDSYAGTGGEMIELGAKARITAGLAVWMALWWMTEAIPVYATALLPLAVLPATGAVPIKDAAVGYADELIFLYMSGFILALSMQRWGLHRRIALGSLRVVGTRPKIVIGGFMAITATLSMWVSNTATALMMMPIAASLIDLLDDPEAEGESRMELRNFGVCMLLGIAYAASIGGLGTIIGSPPNVLVASFMKKELGIEVSFLEWMMIGVPLVMVFLPLTWFLLTRFLYPVRMKELRGGAAYFRDNYAALGKPKRGEWIVFIVFMATALCWIFRPLLKGLTIGSFQPFANVGDAGVGLIAALLLFMLPVDRKGTRVIDWEWASKLPWGLLLLFGGGLSLASALDKTGVSAFIGSRVGTLDGLSPVLMTLLVATMVIFLTELTSNVATAAALVPILAAVALGLGIDPVTVILPAALAASCAFMLPVATPPNAIVYGTGRITIAQMAHAGIWLNLIGIVIITLVTYALIIPILGER
jgi:sodium-dependent dicarboxylate transporter 2/3/5